MISFLKKQYKRQQFNPSFLGLFINPFYLARKGLYKNISELCKQLNGKLLDIGCGDKPYQSIMKVDEYIGLEIESSKNIKTVTADVFYDGLNMPFDDQEFDSLLCNQVLEHVFNPAEFLAEVNRVTKQDGLLLLTVPFVWDEHEQPYDFARYSSFGLKHLFHEYGFEIIEHRKVNNDITVIFQLASAYFYKVFYVNNPYIRVMITALLIAPINIIGFLLSFITPKNDDLYLDNVILAKKVKHV